MSPNAESYTDSNIVGKVAKKWIQKQRIDRKMKDVLNFVKNCFKGAQSFQSVSFSMEFYVIFSAGLNWHKIPFRYYLFPHWLY